VTEPSDIGSDHLCPPGQTRAVRDTRIDALRGIAIALIVVQHLGWAHLSYRLAPGLAPAFADTWSDLSKLGTFWYWALVLSAPFCVNVFAFVSGYLLAASSARSFGAFVRSRFLTLMVPFLAWVVVYWLDPQSALFFVHKRGLLSFVEAALRNPVGGLAGPVWFLYPLFFSSVIVFGANRTRFANTLLVLCIATAVILPTVLDRFAVVSTFGLIETIVLVPFVAIGAIVRRRRALRWRADWRRLVIAVAAYAGFWVLRSSLGGPIARLPRPWNSPVSVLRHDVPPLLLALAGIWMCLELLAMLPERTLRPPAWLGVHSLGVCGAQLPAIALLVSLGIRSPWAVFPATLGLCAAISWLLDTNRVTRAVFLGGRFSGSARTVPATAGPPRD
jgi:fucose 4-O-acetylase-like acetyltransferase